MSTDSRIYVCNACGWEYDPEQGDPDGGIAPGTPWEDIPDDWVCPVCGVGKEDFEPVGGEQANQADSAEFSEHSVVIVGSGLAGYSLARELRRLDKTMTITVITADGGEAYSKPMLSNALARHHQPEDMVQKSATTLAAELDLTVRTRTMVLEIDRDGKRLRIEDDNGQGEIGYGRLVLALGANPRVFPATGSAEVDIFTVNDLDDYRRWRERIGERGRILLIGAGLIGCEFANDLASAGFKVALVDPGEWPLSRLLPEALGNRLARALEDIGCELHLGRTVAEYHTDQCQEAVLDDGTRVRFDHVLSAVGLAPRAGLADQAGLSVDAGIRVDRMMRSSDPEIYALGDCAQTEAGPLPFIAPLLAQAKALAATLAGEASPLVMPAMPVVVKTPALPLVVCPPPAGRTGDWEIDQDDEGALALFRDKSGAEVGFALAGNRTSEQREWAKRMPDLLAPLSEQETPADTSEEKAETQYECDVCGYVYDPAEGDPDGGIEPGTPWEDIPDDWVCPVCGAGKDDFSAVT